MTQTYAQRKWTGSSPETAEARVSGPSVRELAAGAAPTQAQMGSRVDLPGEIREKMESSFGADFSNVKLYESDTVAQAGAEAVTQGTNIAFAPGKLDLTSTAGQALLGHELSHVVSQARGESAGQGFLNDAHLEAQADRQGMIAAQGQSVYAGPVSPLGTSSAAGAAGPMQASKATKTKDGTDVSEFAGEDPLTISEPMILQQETDELNTGIKTSMPDAIEKRMSEVKEKEKKGLSALNYKVNYHTGYDVGRAYGAEKPSEEFLDKYWHDIFIEGTGRGSYNRENAAKNPDEATLRRFKNPNELLTEMAFRAGPGQRAKNGLSFENFMLGIANARKRRGLDREEGTP